MAKEKDLEFEEEFDDEFDDEEFEEQKPKKKKEQVQVPMMLELVYSFSLIITILMAVVVAIMSFLSGADWLDVFIRTAITIMSTGLLAWFFSLMVSNGASKTIKVLQEEALELYKNGGADGEISEEDGIYADDENMDVEQSEE